MIRYLRGTVFLKQRTQLIIDVHGVGYNVTVSPATLTQATIGEPIALHIGESIREDAYDLYGFIAQGEADMFALLRKVSGVGPKVALAITSFYSPADLVTLLLTNDATKLSLVPGIGKKLASKIIVELKDKQDVATSIETDPKQEETIAALESLGYSRSEIATVLGKIPSELASTNERITWVLRHMGE